MITIYPNPPDSYNTAAISAGKITGKTATRALGRHPGINNALTDLCDFLTAGTLYVPPAAAAQMRFVSSSANDAAAGTGIRTVEFHYLDNAYVQQTEIVTLNGVTPVNTVATNILRVNGAYGVTAGTGGVAAGNIQLQNLAGTTVYSQISTGYSTAMCAFFTVPLGKKFILTSWNIGEGTASGSHYTQFFLQATASQDAVLTPGIFQVLDISSAQNSDFDNELNVPMSIPATADIKIGAISDAVGAGAICTAHFGGWLE